MPVRRAPLLAVLGAVLLSGCAGSRHAPRVVHATVCTPAARAAVAGYLRVTATAVSVTATRAPSAAPECIFRTVSAGHRVTVSVEVDREPQAYAVFERTVAEASQIFGPVRFESAPQDIPTIGLDGDWYPDAQHLLTTDGVRLVTATVHWPAARQPQRRALAIASARPYLGPVHRPTFKSLYG